MIYIIYHRYLFTKIQSMRHFLKIIHSFPLLENCDEIGKIWFFFELLLILPIRILGNKTWHVFYLISGLKNPKIHIHSSQVDQFFCKTYITKSFNKAMLK